MLSNNGKHADKLFSPDCAWCWQECGIQPLHGSHGICERHTIAVMGELLQRRKARKQHATLVISPLVTTGGVTHHV